MSDDKLDQAIFKIFRMTHDGTLSWEHKKAPELWQKANEVVYPVYFETLYQGRKLALFQQSSALTEMARLVKRAMNESIDERSSSIHLALLGNNDELLFEFPRSRMIDDIFSAVRYKEANVDEFIDALLKSEPASEK